MRVHLGGDHAAHDLLLDLVAFLREQGHEVLVLDREAERDGASLAVDLTNYGHVVDALEGLEAVVHLAAIPAPGLVPEATLRYGELKGEPSPALRAEQAARSGG